MMISLGALSTLVICALGIAILTPVLLIILVVRDWKRGVLW